MAEIAVDEQGFPLLLINGGPPAPASDPKPAAEPPATGLHAPPSGITQDEWDRRADAVRDAAREFEVFSSQDAGEWVKGRTQRTLNATELEQFTADVRQQVITDLSDILDQTERGKLRLRRTVRVSAPRGYVRKTMKSLTGAELASMTSRLQARGWTSAQLAGLAAKHDVWPGSDPAPSTS